MKVTEKQWLESFGSLHVPLKDEFALYFSEDTLSVELYSEGEKSHYGIWSKELSLSDVKTLITLFNKFETK